MANRIQLRRDTQANWLRVNPILEDGEPGLDITQNKIKYGDGSSTWTELAYASGESTGGSGDTLVNGEYTVSLGADGVLTLPNGMTIDSYGTSGANATVTIGGDDTQIRIDNDGAPPGFYITANATGTAQGWHFGPDGTTTFPSSNLTISHGQGDAISTTDLLNISAAGGIMLTSAVDAANLSQINLDGFGNIQIRSIYNNATDYRWDFNSDGTLTLPLDSSIQTVGNTAVARLQWLPTAGNVSTSTSVYVSAGGVSIETDAPGNENTWLFGTDGRLTLADGTSFVPFPASSSEWTAGSEADSYVSMASNNANTYMWVNNAGAYIGTNWNVSSHTWTFGNTGTTTFPGNVTIGTGYGNISQIDTIFANNYAYANGVSILDGIGGSYGNTEVAQYLTNYDGDINFTSSVAIISNVDVITVLDSIRSPAYQYSNGVSILSGLGYGNTEVATYLASGDLQTAQIHGNLTVGNLTVNGSTTTISTNSYVVTDNIVQFADGNPADTLDVGFVAHRTVGSALQHTGLIRDASTGQWKLFSNVAAQPGSTVDFTGVIYDDLVLDKLYADTIHLTGTAPSTNLGAAGDLEGDIHVDDNYLYYCTQDWTASSWTVGWGGSTSNTLFLTQGDYPTPQVGWIVDQGGDGPWTIDTISDTGYGSWQITWVGGNFGSPTGGTATLTNPSPAVIWKTVQLTTFQTGAYGNTQVASYLSTYSGNIGNVKTTANVITSGYFLGNGALLTGIPTTYSNTNVAAYLTTSITTGAIALNASGGMTTNQTTFPLVNGTATTINFGGAATTLNMGAATVAVSVGSGAGNITAGNITATTLATTGSGGNISGVGAIVSSANLTLTTGAYSSVFDNQGNVRLPSAYVTGNVTATRFIGDGSLLTNIASGGSSTYGDSNVASYLGNVSTNIKPATRLTYTLGEHNKEWASAHIQDVYIKSTLQAGDGGIGYSGGNAGELLKSTGSGIAWQEIKTVNGNSLFGNGDITISGGASTYGDSNVASYLTTYTGNITAGNITATGNVTAANIITSGATSGNISGANYISANVLQVSTGIFWANGTAWSSGGGGTTYTSTGAGNVTIVGSAINLTASGPGATSVGSSTAIPVITTDAYGRISTMTTAAVVAPAGTLSGSTLTATVTASSLTSVGTLVSLAVTGNVSAANVAVTNTVTAANIVTTGTYGNITGANVISANTVTVTTCVRTQPVTFSALPSASGVGAGARAFITDGNTSTFSSQVSGSGANAVPVYSNGTNWYVG